MKIFTTSFIQVFLVAVNTIFLANGIIIGIAIMSFLISYVWVTNVKKANIASKMDQIIYASGAMAGGLSGYLFTSIIFTLWQI
jgi:hypothetical protein